MIACGSARSGILHARESGVGQLIGWELGIEGVPVYNEKAFCASGALAFNIAHMALASGAHDVALVVGVEKMSSRDGKGRPLTSDGMVLEGEQASPPGVLRAWPRGGTWKRTAHPRADRVSRREETAQRHNTIRKAQYRDPISIDDVLTPRIGCARCACAGLRAERRRRRGRTVLTVQTGHGAPEGFGTTRSGFRRR